MKTKKNGIILLVSLTALIITVLSSCYNESVASIDLSANDLQKEAAFSQILDNQELFNEFMDRMMQESQTMNWMMEDGEFMQHMFSDESMDYMMEHNQRINPETMRDMMQRHLSDSAMMHDDMMHN